MKKTLLIIALLGLGTGFTSMAQDEDVQTDVNQYGQTVKIYKVKPEMQDDILVFKN